MKPNQSWPCPICDSELKRRNRAVKRNQGWRCARCGATAGGRDRSGHLVALAVVTAAGRREALCRACRREAGQAQGCP